MVMIMNNTFNIGNRIHQLRVNHELSQEQLALAANITPNYLGLIERNKKCPTIRIVEQICVAMNMTLSEFFSTANTATYDDTFATQLILLLKNKSDDEKRLILNIIKQIVEYNENAL